MNPLLADPLSGGPLKEQDGVLRSGVGVWPILGGVPILVPEPSRWLASARSDVLASLAEAGRLREDDLDRLEAFASAVRGAVPSRPSEETPPEEHEAPDLPGGPAQGLVKELLSRRSALLERLAAAVQDGPVAEVGCGSMGLTRRLTPKPLLVLDRSLGAVLRATARTQALPVVALPEALPLATGSLATVVAPNLVDRLADPEAFVAEAHRVLAPRGRLVLSTADPALGVAGPEEALLDILEDLGFRVESDEDGIPWVRTWGPRHHQLLVNRVVVARRR